ncbi:hypothetical protein V7S43_013782 [Phytophthora oleae]|uniref:Uncharacterized protein n=1 Tax=Phytophthora oleae TaxID=2107226 RepID=A0ABD3F300_9STRA
MAAPAIPPISIPIPPYLLPSIDRINAALEVAVEQPPPATGTLRVCQATEDEWNAFAITDGNVVHANFLEWFADTEEIHMIEFDNTPHAMYIAELSLSTFDEPCVRRWLKGYSSAANLLGTRWCPDMSYGPRRTTPGSVLPPGVSSFVEFRTIKIGIGVSQPWGMARRQLDRKAISVWAKMPGVEYALCVKFDPDFTNAEYKLYDARANPLVPVDPVLIVAPRTVIHLDGRRILGVPPDMALPSFFPEILSVDLYGPLIRAME